QRDQETGPQHRHDQAHQGAAGAGTLAEEGCGDAGDQREYSEALLMIAKDPRNNSFAKLVLACLGGAAITAACMTQLLCDASGRSSRPSAPCWTNAHAAIGPRPKHWNGAGAASAWWPRPRAWPVIRFAAAA